MTHDEAGQVVDSIVVPVDRSHEPVRGPWRTRVIRLDEAALPRVCAACGAPGAVAQEMLWPETWRYRRNVTILLMSIFVGLMMFCTWYAPKEFEEKGSVWISLAIFLAGLGAHLYLLGKMMPPAFLLTYSFCESCAARFHRLGRTVIASSAGLIGIVVFFLILVLISIPAHSTALDRRVDSLFKGGLAVGAVIYCALLVGIYRRTLMGLVVEWLPDGSALRVRRRGNGGGKKP